ncbi:hypothetical protein Barb6XT_02372 [Bacteroidales bacterium Barb6XT]|nr:hypothetical protein Barb6XT_02372 [Bacteroidales bacterium Barb6XT]
MLVIKKIIQKICVKIIGQLPQVFKNKIDTAHVSLSSYEVGYISVPSVFQFCNVLFRHHFWTFYYLQKY